MELTLIRHTRPTLPADVCIGQMDVECAAGWEAHAERIARVVGAPDRLITSPLKRCQVLAERLGVSYKLTPELDPRLLELSFGEWQNRRWSEIGHTATQVLGADFFDHAPPGGESYRDMMKRVDSFLVDLGESFERVAVVSHSGPIRALLVRCLDLPAEAGARFDLGFGRASRLAQRGGAWRLELLNA